MILTHIISVRIVLGKIQTPNLAVAGTLKGCGGVAEKTMSSRRIALPRASWSASGGNLLPRCGFANELKMKDRDSARGDGVIPLATDLIGCEMPFWSEIRFHKRNYTFRR